MHSDEDIQLRDTLRSFFKSKITSKYFRSRFEGRASSDPELRKEIEALGLFAADSLMQQGIIAHESGYSLLPEFLSDYIFGAVCLKKARKANELKNVVYAGFEYKPLGFKKIPKRLSHQFNHLPAALECDGIVFKVSIEGNEQLCLIHLNDKNAFRESNDYLDKSMRYGKVTVKDAEIEHLDNLNATDIQSEYFALIACMLAGAAEKSLELTLNYAKTRKQFDNPIGAFQAIQHQLADMYLRVETMQAVAGFACFTSEKSREQIFLAGQSALRYCSEAAPETAERAIQIHGGIGFTWEYDLHFYLRRIRMLVGLTSFVHSESGNLKFIESISR